MHRFFCYLATIGVVTSAYALLSVVGPGATAADFSIESAEVRTVAIDGKPFAEYRTHSGHQPIVWPIYDGNGRTMTRAYPMGPQGEHEWDDHPHHRSLWFTHGIVNGHDFWLEPDHQHRGRREAKNRIVHREFLSTQADDDGAVIITRNDWMAGDERVLVDKRTLRFGAENGLRWIDFKIELRALDGEVEFGDTKEGTFAVRVPGTMKVDEKMGGELVNNHGQTNGDAWGREAVWVNYTGPVDGEPAGIAIFCHPDSARYPSRWHVRTYGLFAANPFGARDFPQDDDGVKQGAFTIPEGESATFRYLVLLHGGDLTTEQLEAWHKRFAEGEL